MALLTEAEARAVIERALAASKADGCEVSVGSGESGNVRFARNAVSTSGASSNTSLFVRSMFGKRAGGASANTFDADTIARTVAASEELARLAPEDPEFMPPVEPSPVRPGAAFADSTAAMDAAARARAAREGIEAARARDVTAAGFLNHTANAFAFGNSRGTFAYHRQTDADYSVTMRTADGTGSGYGTTDSHDASRLEVGGVSRLAAEKAVASRNPRAIEPGKYTVILEPAASVDLLQQLIFNLDARAAEEGRSYLSRAGGGTRLGEQLLDPRVTISSDPLDPIAPVATWNGDGRPRERTVWFDKGVVRNHSWSRFWAQRKGVAPVVGPGNFLMSGGDATTESLIRGTERGVLVTRTWYIRSVDPQTLLFTGLTRDGTFYIENGRIAFAVKNLRFNESPVIMLNNVDELGRPERVQNAETGVPSVIPPMRIRDFTFSSLSDAI